MFDVRLLILCDEDRLHFFIVIKLSKKSKLIYKSTPLKDHKHNACVLDNLSSLSFSQTDIFELHRGIFYGQLQT
jgi:hypothetical protein